MTTTNVKRKYSFSDAVLLALANKQINLLRKDVNDFIAFGFDASKISTYQSKIDAFADCPTDNIFEGEKMISTEEKRGSRQELEQSIRIIQFAAENTYSSEPAYLRAFGSKKLSNITDIALLKIAEAVEEALINYGQALFSNGLTQIQADAFADYFDAFAQAQKTQQQAIYSRDINAVARIKAGNEVYSLLVQYNKLGRMVYPNKKYPKHDHYVIYSAPKTKTKPN
jgi:hypothetical protein